MRGDLQHHQIDRNRMPSLRRSGSSSSSSRSVDSLVGRSLRVIEEVPTPPLGISNGSDDTQNAFPEVDQMDDKVYVAVGKEEANSTLTWALQNTPREKKIVLAHVYCPAPLIPMLGGKFPANQLTDQQVKAYRLREREKMNKTLDECLLVCASVKAQAEKLVIEMDNVAKGLVELIACHGITKLVMGAAADKHYSKKMKLPRSKTANFVQKEALPTCKIWFVCKGNLIYTREASLEGHGTPSFTASKSTRSTQSEPLRSKSFGNWVSPLTNPVQDLFRYGSRSANYDLHEGVSRQEPVIRMPTPLSMGSNCSLSSSSLSDGLLSSSSSMSMTKDRESEDVSVILPCELESGGDLPFSSPLDDLEDVGVDNNDVYDQLQEAIIEAETLKREAYEESCRRRKAERDALEATRKAKASENSYVREVKQRKQIEETLAKIELDLENLKSQRDQLLEELQHTHDQKSELENRIMESDHVVMDLEKKLSASQHLLDLLQKEREDLQQKVDHAVREAEKLRQQKEEVTMSTDMASNFSVFSYIELEQATQNFDNSLKIGEGGYGCVYKGFLRHTTVAIKLLHPESTQGQSEFHQEVEVLSKVRHPNLVTLIGACPEACSLIYEFLPNGSLEDHLVCKDNTPPLSWQVRTCIVTEICSALIFLHSNKPHSVVHGDLKPSNILIGANFVSKLGDFGISRLLIQSATTTTLYRRTDPKGTLVYMDPEFISTGELTTRSDIYSFGVILLRLLTGRPALGIIKEVQEALRKENLHAILDPSAGNWPCVQAQQLAELGLSCCEMNRKNRPNLVGEVWRILEPMKTSLPLRPLLPAEERSCIPPYFVCPISQEIMRDPHVAADGFTYEAEALKGWLESGNCTSPMTNLKLAHCDLIPNRALRSAIQEWLHHQQS